MAIYVPELSTYFPLYIQTSSDSYAKDTATTWGLVAKSNLYASLPEMKEPYSNDWDDEDGLDEYLEKTHFKELTPTISFYVKCYADGDKTAAAVLQSQVQAFFAKICSGSFSIYDSYTALGYQGVRYSKCSNEDFVARNDWARMTFDIEFQINDPITRMTFSDGAIVTA